MVVMEYFFEMLNIDQVILVLQEGFLNVYMCLILVNMQHIFVGR